MDEKTERHLQWLDEESDRHSWDNREEIKASEKCICTACGEWLLPQEIVKWWEDKHACCPRCGLTGCVVGSASGLPLEEFAQS